MVLDRIKFRNTPSLPRSEGNHGSEQVRFNDRNSTRMNDHSQGNLKLSRRRLLSILGAAACAPGVVPLTRVWAANSGASAGFAPLRTQRDTALQQAMDNLFVRRDLSRAVREGRLGASLVDVSDIHRPRLASVNGDGMIYAASLPKIAILLGVFEEIESGALKPTWDVLDKATRMIRQSSNLAATQLFYTVGPARLAQILQSDRYRLYDAAYGGGLWMGKPYARRQVWQRDPIANLSHGATAVQVARFLYLLQTERLVSREHSRTMKSIMSNPGIQHKFVKGLAGSRPEAKIYRKSGTWRTYHADGCIVERAGAQYIAVVLANDPAGSRWLSELIVRFDEIIDQTR